MWSELAAPLNIDSKYGPELPQLPKDYGQMIRTDLNSMHKRLK
jgi:hypothetical protein